MSSFDDAMSQLSMGAERSIGSIEDFNVLLKLKYRDGTITGKILDAIGTNYVIQSSFRNKNARINPYALVKKSIEVGLLSDENFKWFLQVIEKGLSDISGKSYAVLYRWVCSEDIKLVVGKFTRKSVRECFINFDEYVKRVCMDYEVIFEDNEWKFIPASVYALEQGNDFIPKYAEEMGVK